MIPVTIKACGFRFGLRLAPMVITETFGITQTINIIVTLGLVFMVFGIYSLSRYVKVKKEKAKPAEPEEKVSRSMAAGEMTEEEAYFILEVRQGATKEDIQRAFKRMMMEFHPDRQGNAYMATKINQARETLLKK